ncbi:MAG TPA: hypothetical protein VEK07_04620 [Polyangiaceae bacterium]|nr:hypothetical protein [Polyangiaceae bacterium]
MGLTPIQGSTRGERLATTPPGRFADPLAAAGSADALSGGVSGPTPLDIENVLSAMAALLLADRSSDERAGAAAVQSDRQQTQEALQKQMQEIEREARDTGGHGFFSCIGKLLKDVSADVTQLHIGRLPGDALSDVEACDNPKFWSDLEVGAKAVSAIAAAAATVCTAGAAGPLVVAVAVALSAAGWAVQETRWLGSASGWVGGGLALAGAAVSCGGALAASSTAAATALAQSASTTTNSTSLAQTAGAAATMTGAGATIVSAAAHLGVSGYQADDLQAQAEAQAAASSATLFAQMEQWAIDSLSEQVRSHCDAMAVLTDTIQTSNREALVAARSLSRG